MLYIWRFPPSLPHQFLLPALARLRPRNCRPKPHKRRPRLSGPMTWGTYDRPLDWRGSGFPRKCLESLCHNPLIHLGFNLEFVFLGCRRLFSLVVVASFVFSFKRFPCKSSWQELLFGSLRQLASAPCCLWVWRTPDAWLWHLRRKTTRRPRRACPKLPRAQ